MMRSVVTVQVTCESVDVEQVKEELKAWYFSSGVGMEHIEFSVREETFPPFEEDVVL